MRLAAPRKAAATASGQILAEAPVRPEPVREMGRLRAVVAVTGTLIGIVIIWELVTAVFHVKPLFLRSPQQLYHALVATPSLWVSNSGTTFYEVLVGFGVAAALGIGLGILVVYSPVLQITIYPIILVLQIAPKVAVAPLLVVFMGFGLLPKVVVVVLVAFFPIMVNTVSGLKAADADILDLVRVLNGSRWQEFRHVRFPHALPFIFSGLKVGITLSVIGAVIGEFVGANKGLGYVMIIAGAQMNIDQSYVSLLLMSLEGMVLYGILALIEPLLMPWTKH